jgi:hypothetical protein
LLDQGSREISCDKKEDTIINVINTLELNHKLSSHTLHVGIAGSRAAVAHAKKGVSLVHEYH